MIIGLMPFEAVGSHNEIDQDHPDNFVAEQVIYRKLSFYGDWYYIERHKPILISKLKQADPQWTIEEHVRNIVQNGQSPYFQDVMQDEELAIPNLRHSYIVLELDNKISWTFASKNSGITLGAYDPDQPTADRLYGWLRHVHPTTGDSVIEPVSKSRLVYFEAVQGTDGHKQKFYFNLEGARGTVTNVDPDIRYPGNGGNP